MNSSQSVNSSPKSNEEFKAMNSSDEPFTGKGLGVVETPKNSSSTVLGSSVSAGTFDEDDETQQSDLWEVEI